jgi:hypothetical protein
VFDALALAFVGNDLLGGSGLGYGKNGYGHGKVSSGRISEVGVEGVPNRFRCSAENKNKAGQMHGTFASLRMINMLGAENWMLL